MNVIADILLAAGALGAGLYCHVLARRLRRFTDLEQGVGGAVSLLSSQVDDLSRTLARAKAQAAEQDRSLARQTDRAEDAATRLELLIASMHDLPEPPATAPRPAASPTATAARKPFFVRHPARAGEDR